MNCELVYGISCSIRHYVEIDVTSAFRSIPDLLHQGWLYVDVYYNDRLVYTTQGVSGFRFICADCPYC